MKAKEFKEQIWTIQSEIASLINNYVGEQHNEDNPIECDFVLECGAVGLSDLEKPNVIGIYKNEYDDIVLKMYGSEDSFMYLSDLDLSDQVLVLEWLEENLP